MCVVMGSFLPNSGRTIAACASVAAGEGKVHGGAWSAGLAYMAFPDRPPLRLGLRPSHLSPTSWGRGKAPSHAAWLPLPRRSGERWFAKQTGVGVDHAISDGPA